MKLKIYDVAYYTKFEGRNEAVAAVCHELCELVQQKTYCSAIDYVRISPIAAPKEVLSKGLWSEYCKVWKSSKDAAVSLQMDYQQYKAASDKGKVQMVIQNILDSVRILSSRIPFDVASFEQDVADFVSRRYPDYAFKE